MTRTLHPRRRPMPKPDAGRPIELRNGGLADVVVRDARGHTVRICPGHMAVVMIKYVRDRPADCAVYVTNPRHRRPKGLSYQHDKSLVPRSLDDRIDARVRRYTRAIERGNGVRRA